MYNSSNYYLEFHLATLSKQLEGLPCLEMAKKPAMFKTKFKNDKRRFLVQISIKFKLWTSTSPLEHLEKFQNVEI